MLDFLFFCGQVASLAGLACGCYLTLIYGREETLRKAVATARFAEFDRVKEVPAIASVLPQGTRSLQ